MKTDTAERNDIDELTLLNRDYIHSVQHGDVRRFDEILAEDFHRHLRLRRVELPVALFDAASPLEAGNGCADVVRASSLACGGDFLLRLAVCQSKHLITEAG